LIVGFLLLSGCGLFGGGGTEQPTEVPVETPDKPIVETPPPPQRMRDEARFQDAKYDAIQKVVKGSLNWSKGVIRAEGYGLPTAGSTPQEGKLLALEAAYADAIRNLLGIVNGVNINATTTIEGATVRNKEIIIRIEGKIQGAVLLKKEFIEADQMAKVIVGLFLEDIAEEMPESVISGPMTLSMDVFQQRNPMQGRFSTLALFQNDFEIEHTPDGLAKALKTLGEENQKLRDELSAIRAALDPKETPNPYSGIIINTSDRSVKYALFPRIYYLKDEGYHLLYGDVNQNRPNPQQVEMGAAWARLLSDAQNNPLVKGNPLIIEAIGVNGLGEPAISAEDAAKVESLNQKYHLLEQGKVVIVGNLE